MDVQLYVYDLSQVSGVGCEVETRTDRVGACEKHVDAISRDSSKMPTYDFSMRPY